MQRRHSVKELSCRRKLLRHDKRLQDEMRVTNQMCQACIPWVRELL